MSETDTVSTEAVPLADTADGGGTMVDLANLWPIGLALLILFDSGNSTDTGPSDHDQKNDDTSG